MPSLFPRCCTAVMVVALLLCGVAAHAQTYTVLHNFSGGADGAQPAAALTMDRGGNLYGTTSRGGTGQCSGGGAGCGVVFKLTHLSSGWVETLLYSFQGGNDGQYPAARVVFGPDGALYGTTSQGGSAGVGTVFRLTPPSTICHAVLCPWNKAVLYSFTGGNSGADANPSGALAFDRNGNIYGTTSNGGEVYELSRNGNGWTQTILFTFNYTNGAFPYGGVILDNAGNLYGTLGDGPYPSGGAVFELTKVGSTWTQINLYEFQDDYDGGEPVGGLIWANNGSGCLLGSTTLGPFQSQLGSGTTFSVCPNQGQWVFMQSNVFEETGGFQGPRDSLAQDAAGNIYGTWDLTAFKFGPQSNPDLHDFNGGANDESNNTGVVLDANGNVYGTADGGSGNCPYGCGVVYEITQ